MGHNVIEALKKHTNLPFDVHLMINNPAIHIENFAKAGSSIITVHVENTTHLDRTITAIKAYGIKAGVSLVPSTHEDTLDYIIDKIDRILVMTVNPGFGGQIFLDSQLIKIKKIAKKIAGRDIELAVDGGINSETSKLVKQAGANVLIAGNHIFKCKDRNYMARISELR
jgi:ribulose-phosphate 3-epimerase